MPSWLDKILNSQFVMIGLAGLAFLIALWLVIVIVRMLTGGRLRTSSGRTRQARLGIVDAFDLDRQRQLIIVRRDNTEHLIMIGGPNDLVIESEIVRVEARESRRLTDKAEGPGENRIPAPTMPPESQPSSPAADEPLLPMVLPPQMSEREVVMEPALDPVRAEPIALEPMRAPTFPLPPRRPAPLPERRAPPPLPETASRLENVASEPVIAVAPPALEPRRPEAVAQPSVSEATAPRMETRDDAAPRLPVRTPPSFLKPLPPRPPIRPLRRATPVAVGTAAATPGPDTAETVALPGAKPSPDTTPVAPVPVANLPVASLPVPAATSEPSVQAPPQPPQEQPAKVEEANPLESLEEEMAKLLGRG